MDYRVDFCETAPQAVLRLPREIRADRPGEDIAVGVRELMAIVERAGLTANGPATITFSEQLPPDGTTIADFGMPIEPAPALSMQSGAEVVVATTTLVARTCHRGSYTGLHAAYHALRESITRAGYCATAPATEAYLVGPDEVNDARQLITEIRIPIAPLVIVPTLVRAPFEPTLAAAREALRTNGFDILSEIDLHTALHPKPAPDNARALVLEICHRRLARRALEADERAARMVTSTVILREWAHATLIEVVDPAIFARTFDSDTCRSIADETRRRLNAAIDTLSSPAAAVPAASGDRN